MVLFDKGDIMSPCFCKPERCFAVRARIAKDGASFRHRNALGGVVYLVPYLNGYVLIGSGFFWAVVRLQEARDFKGCVRLLVGIIRHLHGE